NFTFNQGSGTTGTDIDVSVAPTDTVDGLLAAIQAALPAGTTVAVTGGVIALKGADADDVLNIADNTTGSSGVGFGLPDGDVKPTVTIETARTARVPTIAAEDVDAFFAQSISGGAI